MSKGVKSLNNNVLHLKLILIYPTDIFLDNYQSLNQNNFFNNQMII